jgi:hypothetical protein
MKIYFVYRKSTMKSMISRYIIKADALRALDLVKGAIPDVELGSYENTKFGIKNIEPEGVQL